MNIQRLDPLTYMLIISRNDEDFPAEAIECYSPVLPGRTDVERCYATLMETDHEI
ncbi:hypothetical protein LG201_11385 [Methylobacillus gramineus]|uniref:hypothetical protein n=1 Tax=Methylobacillus gramineus TaxID=755169 RepID=UPI001CFF6344|nr:hypothetical protein [Methylobacillus gramineus]MCB5185804.1 hypothetical protein [Methylobacillus gramineus]